MTAAQLGDERDPHAEAHDDGEEVVRVGSDPVGEVLLGAGGAAHDEHVGEAHADGGEEAVAHVARAEARSGRRRSGTAPRASGGAEACVALPSCLMKSYQAACVACRS